MVWTTDAAGAITFFNRRWVDYTGITVEAGRRGWMSAVHPDDLPRLPAAWQRALAGQAPRYPPRVPPPPGRDGAYRWMLGARRPLAGDEHGVVEWVGTLTDIDDQKRQAERLERMVRERTLGAQPRPTRRCADEVEERGQRRGRASAPPASSCCAATRSSSSSPTSPRTTCRSRCARSRRSATASRSRFHDQLAEQGRDYIDRMLSSAVRMRRLIDDLLTVLARHHQARSRWPASTSTRSSQGVLADLEVRIEQGRGRRRGRAAARDRGRPDADAAAVPEPDRQRPEVRRPRTPPRSPHFRRAGRAARAGGRGRPGAASGWRISFADNGIGFDEKYLDRIFQVFQRLHGRDEYEGTGVGLAICRKIVERHGGVITARSRPGQGATFILTLPCRTTTQGKE